MVNGRLSENCNNGDLTHENPEWPADISQNSFIHK